MSGAAPIPGTGMGRIGIDVIRHAFTSPGAPAHTDPLYARYAAPMVTLDEWMCTLVWDSVLGLLAFENDPGAAPYGKMLREEEPDGGGAIVALEPEAIDRMIADGWMPANTGADMNAILDDLEEELGIVPPPKPRRNLG